MDKDPRVFLKHILECIELVGQYTAGKSMGDFIDSLALQDQVTRRIEIIGEAVRHLSDAFKRRHPDIPWKKIAGTRDKLIHEYFGVDLHLTWEVVKRDLPKLKRQILSILESNA